MIIVKGKNKYKYDILVEINEVSDLVKFIKNNNIKKNFLNFNSKFKNKIVRDIKKIDIIFYKKFIKWLNTFFPGKNSIRTLEYWINRGYSNVDAKKQLYDYQSQFGKIYDWNNHPEKLNTKIEYWLNKGYSNNEAIDKLKKRQATFSKEKLIKKYGEDEGTQKLKNRNKKWLISLYNNNDMDALYYKRTHNGLTTIRTLIQYVDYYGEFDGKVKFAKRYWGICVKSIKQFNKIYDNIKSERTRKFYNKDYRLQILKEQECKCGNCDIENTRRHFHLHHIDYVKKNDNRYNLIFLCHNCHSKTTFAKDRQFYIKYYKKINKKIIKDYEKKI